MISEKKQYDVFYYTCNAHIDSVAIKLVDKYLIQRRAMFTINGEKVSIVGDSIVRQKGEVSEVEIDTFEVLLDSVSLHYMLVKDNEIKNRTSLPLIVGKKSTINYKVGDNQLFFIPSCEIELLDISTKGNMLFYRGKTDDYDFELTLHNDFLVPIDSETSYKGEALRNFLFIYDRWKKIYVLDEAYYYDGKFKKRIKSL